MPAIDSDWLRRPRLLELIPVKAESRLIALVAPAGYGKTTFSRQYVEKIGVRNSAWIHLEQEDSDPRRFTAYLIEAICRLYPHFGKHEMRNLAEDSTRTLTEIHDDLLFLLEEKATESKLLVLDNWEEVDKSSETGNVVKRILSLKNHALSIIINSRSQLSFGTARLENDNQAIMLSKEKLAFNLAECEELLSRVSSGLPDHDYLNDLWNASLGWCVAVRMLLRAVECKRGIPRDRGVDEKDIEDRFEAYVTEEMLNGIDSELADFVVRCSVLSQIDSSSASAVVGEEAEVHRMLKALSESGLPITTLERGAAYRLHPLLKQAANRSLHRFLSPEEGLRVYREASAHLLSSGDIIGAVKARAAIRDWEETLRLIDDNWYELVASDDLSTVDELLSAAPPRVKGELAYVDLFSRMLTQKGNNRLLVSYLTKHVPSEKAESDLELIIRLKTRLYWAKINVDNEPDYEGIKGDLYSLIDSDQSPGNTVLTGVEVVLCTAAYMELKIDEGITHAQKGLELIGDSSPEYRMSIIENLAILEHTRGNSKEAIRLMQISIDHHDEADITHGKPLRLYNLAFIYATMGDFRKALSLVEEGRIAQARHAMYSPYDNMYADRYEGQIRWYLGEKEKAIGLLKQAFKTAEEHNPREKLESGLTLDYYAYLSQVRSDWARGLEIPSKGKHHEARLSYAFMEGFKALEQGDAETAAGYAQEILDIASSRGLVPWQISAHFLLSLAQIAEKSDSLARDNLTRGLEQLNVIGWKSYPMANAYISSRICAKSARFDISPEVSRKLASGDFEFDFQEAISQELNADSITSAETARVIKLAEEFAVVGVLPDMEPLAGEPEDAVLKAVQSYRQKIDAIPPPPLQVKTLGTFEVNQKGRFLKFNRKTSRNLFQWLLTVYPAGLHRELIIDYFWAEASIEKGMTSLRTTVKDLRKALDPFGAYVNDAYISFVGEHYYLKLSDDSDVDLSAFKRMLSSLSNSFTDGGRAGEQFEASLRSALMLYGGEYLPGEIYESFAVETREALLTMFMKASLRLAEYLYDCERFSEVDELIRNALRHDPLWGDGVFVLLKALHAQGHAVKALRAFRDYEQRLKAELQIAPDKQMYDLLENVS